MFDMDCLLLKDSLRMEDPFLNHPGKTNARLAVDRQASLDDLAHVIRSDAQLSDPAILDAADTIQDLAKYLKDDSHGAPNLLPYPAASSSSSHPPPPPPTPSPNAPMHNYAAKAPEPQAYKVGSRFPVLIKQERADSPDSLPSPPTIVRPLIQGSHYLPPGLRRKRPIIYKEELSRHSEDEEEEEELEEGEEGDRSSLPPPRKYVRKNPKQIKDLDEYRKRRERNNEAVRRARAKKRQAEALMHSENRQLRAENQRLSTQLEATRLQVQTQERIIAQLRGQQAHAPPTIVQPRLKKAPKRLSP